jgi:NAD(P)H-flavin reductase
VTANVRVPEAMLPLGYRVIGSGRETGDTVTIVLEPSTGDGMAFRPGQFTMLYVYGVGEVPISISGDPADPGVLVHTVRAVGAVTEAIVNLQVGDPVGVRGPYGVGWPLDAAAGKDLLIVAGGIGLAPLRPVMYQALARRDNFSSVALAYGSRTPADLLFVEQLHEWRSRFDLQVEVTVDRSERGWFGDVGVVTGLLTRIPFDPKQTVAMLCGPEIMMKVVGRELLTAGVEAAAIYVSLERNMKCAIGFCGHCQFGPDFVCWGGPVFSYDRVMERMLYQEL